MEGTINVSVIVPCYNVERYVERAVKSVAQACELSHEIILVDNNSTDSTPQVLVLLSQTYQNVVLLSEPKPGAGAARNKGLAAARGKYIQFLDADDELVLGKIDAQVKLLEEGNHDFVVSAYKRIGGPNERIIKPELDLWKALMTTRLGITSSALFSKKALEAVNGWNEEWKSSQEYEIMFRLITHGFSCGVQDDVFALIHDRREEGQISTGDPVPRWNRYLELRTMIITHLRDHELAMWTARKHEFLQLYFDVLHMVYPHVSEKAIALHDQWIRSDYSPVPTTVVGRKFCFLYRVFGFKTAEKITAKLKS